MQLATLGSVTGDDAMWTASMWRVNFKRLAQLHAGFFPDSVSIGTLFDAGSDTPNYLFPLTAAPTELDYADIGIPRHDASGATLPDTFNLGEATRRGLNCLALACVDAGESLAPEIVAEQQGRLATAIVGPVTGDLTDADRSARLGTVRSTLIPLILAYLRFWEWYLRERFFAAGVYAEDQTRLIAFEAGSSMTKLSWGLSIQIVSKPDLTADQLAAIWSATFNDRDVSRLQHQLAVVGTAIGDATRDPRTGENSGQALQTVKRSLEYWQRTVQWLTNPVLNGSIEMTPARWQRLRLQLVEQANIWQALALAQEDLGAYKAEALVQRFLQDVVASFEDIAARQGLLSAVDQVGKQTDEIRSIFARQLRFLTLSIWPLLIVVGLLGVVAFGALVLRLTQQQPVGAPDIGALVLGVLGGLGLLGVRRGVGSAASAATPPPPPAAEDAATTATPAPAALSAPAGLADRLGAVLGQAKDTFIAAFERGFKGIQDDLADLSSAVAITYPLVEYFVLDPTIKGIQAEYDFMVQVVWNNTDRKEEVMRVAYAAFGPLGTFAMASQLKDADPSTRASTT